MENFKGKIILSSSGKEKGTATGATHHCKLEGCTGVRVSTRWPDGKITFPCTKGMTFHKDGTAQIC